MDPAYHKTVFVSSSSSSASSSMQSEDNGWLDMLPIDVYRGKAVDSESRTKVELPSAVLVYGASAIKEISIINQTKI